MAHLGAKDFRNTLEVLQEQRDNIQKGLYGDIEKGGKVIGHTKSGKAIYETHSHESHKEAASRHREIAAVYAKVAEKTGRYGEGMLANSNKHANNRLAEQHENSVMLKKEKNNING